MNRQWREYKQQQALDKYLDENKISITNQGIENNDSNDGAKQ